MAKSDVKTMMASSSGAKESIQLPTLTKQSIFSKWKFRINLFLEQKGVLEVLKVRLKKKVRKREDFKRRDSEARCWIVQSVDDDLLDVVTGCKTAQEMIMKLEAQFQRKTAFSKYDLKKQLLTMKLEASDSLQTHLKRFDQLISELEAIGCKLDESDKVCHLLLTLPEEYKVVITSLDVMMSLGTGRFLEFVKSQLLVSDNRLRKGRNRNFKSSDYSSSYNTVPLSLSLSLSPSSECDRQSASPPTFTEESDPNSVTVKLEPETPEHKTLYDNSSQKSFEDSHSTSMLDMDVDSRPTSPASDSDTSLASETEECIMKSMLNCSVVLQDVAHNLWCAVCNKWCLSNSELHKHKQTHTTPAKPKPTDDMLCSVCYKSFPNKSALTQHILIHERDNSATAGKSSDMKCDTSQGDEKLFYCGVCYQKFSKKANLNMHFLKMHSAEEKTSIDMLNPQETNPTEQAFACNKCNKAYTSAGALQTHVSLHQTQFNCHVCTNVLPNKHLLATHIINMHGEKKITCELCRDKKRFARYSTLFKHSAVMHSDHKMYTCSMCSQKFSLAIEMKYHMSLMHEGEDAFKCDVCSVTYKLESQYRQHEFMHVLSEWENGEMPRATMKLVNTPRATMKLANTPRATMKLANTSRGTPVMKLFECVICKRKYTFRNSLMTHIRKTHSINHKNQCDFCSQEFDTSSILQNHIQINHISIGQKLVCLQCGSASTSLLDMALHHARKHKKDPDNNTSEETGDQSIRVATSPVGTDLDGASPKKKKKLLEPLKGSPPGIKNNTSQKGITSPESKRNILKNPTRQQILMQNNRVLNKIFQRHKPTPTIHMNVSLEQSMLEISPGSILENVTIASQNCTENVPSQVQVVKNGTLPEIIIHNSEPSQLNITDDMLPRKVIVVHNKQAQESMPNDPMQIDPLQRSIIVDEQPEISIMNLDNITTEHSILNDETCQITILKNVAESNRILLNEAFADDPQERIMQIEPQEGIKQIEPQQESGMDIEPSRESIILIETQGDILHKETRDENIIQIQPSQETIMHMDPQRIVLNEPYPENILQHVRIIENEPYQVGIMENEAYQDSIMENEPCQESIIQNASNPEDMQNEIYQESIIQNDPYDESGHQNDPYQESIIQDDPYEESIIQNDPANDPFLESVMLNDSCEEGMQNEPYHESDRTNETSQDRVINYCNY